VVEYFEAGSTAGLQGSDDRVDAAEAERAEAPRAAARGLPVLAELRVVQQSEERDQVAEVAQDPLRVKVTHRPTQSNPKLQPHHLTVPPHTHRIAQPSRRFRLLNGAGTGVALR